MPKSFRLFRLLLNKAFVRPLVVSAGLGLSLSSFYRLYDGGFITKIPKTEYSEPHLKEDPEHYHNTILVPANMDKDLIHFLHARLPNYKIYPSDLIIEDRIEIVNSVGDYKSFNLSEHKLNEVGNTYSDLRLDEHMHEIMNFSNPPQPIAEPELDRLLQYMEKDQNIIVTYIPTAHQYKEFIGEIHPQDHYSRSKVKDLDKLQKEFRSLKYDSPTSKSTYVLVRDPELAQKLQISNYNIGETYILRKSSNLLNNESNFIFNSRRYNYYKAEPNPNHITDSNANKGFTLDQKQQFLVNCSLSYLNQANLQTDLLNFLRTVNHSSSKKLFVLAFNGDEKEDFVKNVEKVLIEIKKIFKNDIHILLTRNKQLLTKHLQIVPDDFVTMRLIDLSKTQPPLNLLSEFKQILSQMQQLEQPDKAQSYQSKYYSRYCFKGAFKYNQLAKFIRDPGEECYEYKKNLKQIHPLPVSMLNEQLDGLVLFEKRGCRGCILYNRVLEQLENVLQEVRKAGINSNEYIIKYKITEPEKVKGLKIYRYNILNQSQNFRSPLATPALYLFRKGQYQIFNIGKSMQYDQQEIIQDVIRFVIES